MNQAKGHTLVFYNVENLYDTQDDPRTADTEFTPFGEKQWTPERLDKKLHDLSEVLMSISAKHPIVIGLTEVENREVVEQLTHTQRMSDVNYHIIHQESTDNRGIDLCLLYDQDHVTYLSHEYLRIHFPWNRDIKTRDVLFFECNIGGEHFWIVANHWPSRRKGSEETEKKRIHVAKSVRKKLDELIFKFPESKILVMGDFNDEPNDLSITRYLKAKSNKNIDDKELFNLSFEDFSKGLGSSTHEGQWIMIDQMMINRNFLQNRNEGLEIVNQKAEIFRPEELIFEQRKLEKPNQTYAGDHYVGGVSDHLPIYVKLS